MSVQDLVQSPLADEITQPWGCVENSLEWVAPWCPSGHYHAGIDIGSSQGGQAILGATVVAPQSGEVIAVGQDGQGNPEFSQYLGPNAVCLQLADATYVEFGHLEQALVTRGELVSAGFPIGKIGSMGSSTAPHLHVEHRRDGPYQGVRNDAMNVLDPRPLLWVQQPQPPAPVLEEESMHFVKANERRWFPVRQQSYRVMSADGAAGQVDLIGYDDAGNPQHEITHPLAGNVANQHGPSVVEGSCSDFGVSKGSVAVDASGCAVAIEFF